VLVRSDEHGTPALVADHFLPLSGSGYPADALDFYGPGSCSMRCRTAPPGGRTARSRSAGPPSSATWVAGATASRSPRCRSVARHERPFTCRGRSPPRYRLFCSRLCLGCCQVSRPPEPRAVREERPAHYRLHDHHRLHRRGLEGPHHTRPHQAVVFGVDTETDWKVGSPLVHRGVYQGRPYQDKGEIIGSTPRRSTRDLSVSPACWPWPSHPASAQAGDGPPVGRLGLDAVLPRWSA
jgi:hypothetical protein